MANTAAKKAAPAKKMSPHQKEMAEAKENYRVLKNAYDELVGLADYHKKEIIKLKERANNAEKASHNNLEMYKQLRYMGETESVGEAYEVIASILWRLPKYEVAALLGELLVSIQQQDKNEQQVIQENIDANVRSKNESKDCADALAMALQGNTDFINIFTAKKRLQDAAKNMNKAFQTIGRINRDLMDSNRPLPVYDNGCAVTDMGNMLAKEPLGE